MLICGDPFVVMAQAVLSPHGQHDFADRYDSLTAFEQLFARKNTSELVDEMMVTAGKSGAASLPTLGGADWSHLVRAQAGALQLGDSKSGH